MSRFTIKLLLTFFLIQNICYKNGEDIRYYRWCHVKIYSSCCKYDSIGCLVVSYRRRIWRNIVCKTWRLKISGYGHNYFRCICLFWIRIIWDSDIKLKRKEYYIYIYLLSFCYQRILIFLHLKVWTFNIDCGLLL